MPKIRVLVVDDSVVIRRLVADALNSDPEIEVAGVAANGRIALDKLEQVRPDAVVLDVEMPVMDGLATLAEIRKRYRRMPVIMFSTLTARGALATIDALALGAADYVTKPANVGGVGEALDRLRGELIPKLKHLCGRHFIHGPGPSAATAVREPGRPVSPPKIYPPSRVDAVVIGVSTGGPNALMELVPELPADLPVPVLIVQHMPPVFTRLLSERLNAMSQITVKEAEPGEPVNAGTAYLAPGDFHMTVERKEGALVIDTSRGAPENSCRPSADVLFRSAVEIFDSHLLGVILTGMGRDGCRGCELLRAAGGAVIAQDEESSVIWGMPGFVVRGELANVVLPLREIAGEIAKRVRRSSPNATASSA